MNAPIAELITIGDEILYGQILDTNSQWMCQKLNDLGIRVKYRHTIGDDRNDILDAFQRARERSNIVLITGGLGPTPDDLTKPLLAEFFNTTIVENNEAVEFLQEMFDKRGYELTERNRLQAHLPESCTMLKNKMGTAPGMWFEENEVIFVAMPGVPSEMKYLMDHEVLPRMKEVFHLPVISHKLVKTAGIGESWLYDLIKDWEESLPENVKIAYLPTLSQVKIRITSFANTQNEADNLNDDSLSSLKPVIEKYIYGYDEDSLEGVIGVMLKEKGWTVSCAESCTGGYLSHLITSVEGSSEYFMGSVISYDNSVKMKELGVDPEVLEEKGAVSEEVVKMMALGVCEKLNTNVGVAVSGIAGPGGGTPEKPVGTVWLACCINGAVYAKLLQLGDRNRITNIQYAALAALNMIRLQINRN